MKVFVLFTGDYEQRSIHSIHTTFDAAKTVDARVRRDCKNKAETPDIEEHELDPDLCLTCVYDEQLHISSPNTFNHPFRLKQRSSDSTNRLRMNADDIAQAILNPRPAWMEPKPCAVCRMEFVPADPRQECCPVHQQELILALRRGMLTR